MPQFQLLLSTRERDKHAHSPLTLSTALLWQDASAARSLELLVYFHHEAYYFSLYPSV